MQAVTMETYGSADGMTVREIPAPVPDADQVLIRTEAIGVGGVDAVIRRGTLGQRFPAGQILGSEVAGVVTAVGPDSDSSWIGRRVWGFTGLGGAYAEQAVAHVDDLTVIPEGLSSVDAVTLGSSATVAHFALAHAHLDAGESVLIRGAAGSIGIAAIELAVRAGARDIAVTTSSVDRGERLRQAGAHHALDRSGQGAPNAPELFDVVIDIVGGPAMPRFLDLLAPNGRMVMVGAIAGFPPEDFAAPLLRSFQQSRSIATFSLDSIPVPRRNAVRASLLGAGARGELTSAVHSVLPLSQAADAHREMDRGSVFGRIVLTPQVAEQA